MNKQYKIGDEVLVRGVVNSEVRNGGIHVLHDGVDAFYMLDQIHEPQTVVVPAFIDSYIRYAKTEGMSLFIAMDNAQNKESEWIITNEETFTRAWFDGYEVEKEQLYAVKLVGTGQYLVERYKRQGYVFIETEDPLLFTKSELESAGFGGVFDNSMFEVEEVE
ncbi:TPA: DUF1642 domain-containing protein [Streptococcus suis]|nr:DUF1642 domain-containing protein [Streptococcus suis]MDW8689583.1 DUF1642 domain-containing protein [Streptococcus suis]